MPDANVTYVRNVSENPLARKHDNPFSLKNANALVYRYCKGALTARDANRDKILPFFLRLTF